MPHIIVKMYPGRTEEQKARIASEITRVMMESANCTDASLSVSIEDVPAADWPETVYRPEILDKPELLFKKPGYNPFS
jgi:4-oxalocrotonate tautomerase